MRRKRLFVLLVMFVIVAVLGFLIYQGVQRNKLANLTVQAGEGVSIWVNGNFMAKGGYEGVLNPGWVRVKVGAYETRVNLVAGVKTIIKDGEIFSLESNGGPGAVIAVASDPIGATVVVDGQDYGTTPVDINNLIAGVHKVSLNLVGYLPSEFEVNSYEGYKLTAYAQLEREKTVVAQSVIVKKTVEIGTTPNGFLRVRSQPEATSSEIARVHDGEKYDFLDQKTGWFEITYDATQSGWISSDYASLVK